MKTREDFDASMQKVSNIQSKFLLYKIRLLTAKTYPNYVRIFTWFIAQTNIWTNFEFCIVNEVYNGT